MKPIISLQLYTMRDPLAQDEIGTLKAIAELGYQGVEIVVSDSGPAVFRASEFGLPVTGAHFNFEDLQHDVQGVIARCREIGTDSAMLSCFDESFRGSAQGWQRLGKILEAAGKELLDSGITLSYHNHAFEFESFGGSYGLDLMYEAADLRYLKAELDTYWIHSGGADEVQYIDKYAGRVPNLHLKDMTPEGDFVEVGEGILDWEAIFAAAEAQGVTTYIVEQDVCKGDPFDSVAKSLENLRKMGKI